MLMIAKWFPGRIYTLRKMNLGAKPSSKRPEFTFCVNEEREERRRHKFGRIAKFCNSERSELARAFLSEGEGTGSTRVKHKFILRRV